MSFVKLDDGILDSSLWVDGDSTRLFIAALLLARPQEFEEPIEQMAVRGFDKTGFVAPPGWYGFIPASGSGLIRRALLDSDQGLKALEKLCNADEESRSCEFEGRRLARVPDGYVVLNFMKYRDKDHTAAERQKRLRDRKKALESSDVTPVTRDIRDVTRNITQSESESESESDKTKTNTLASSDKSLPAAATVFDLPILGNGAYGLPQGLYDSYVTSYPGISVMEQLGKMHAWLLSNPKNMKTRAGMPRFINSWLTRAQNDAPSGRQNKPSSNASFSGIDYAASYGLAPGTNVGRL